MVLERIPQAELHHSRVALNGSKVTKTSSRSCVGKEGVDGLDKPIHCREPLSVCNVENFPTQLQLVIFTPRHTPGLAESHIQRHISRITEDVPITAFAWKSTTEAVVSR